nr:MAG TPA: hypothetical protein [Caudoviricetes sp.]
MIDFRHKKSTLLGAMAVRTSIIFGYLFIDL